jgi:hypothetical protein
MQKMLSYATGSLACFGCAAALYGVFRLCASGGNLDLPLAVILLFTAIASLMLGAFMGFVGIGEASTFRGRLQALGVAVLCLAGLLYVWLVQIHPYFNGGIFHTKTFPEALHPFTADP